MPVTLLPALLALLLAGGSPAVRADTVSETRMPPAALSTEELHDCLSQRERLAQAGHELGTQQAVLERDRAEIERLSEALDVRLGTLDRHSEAAVAGFHEEMLQRDERILAHVDRLPLFHARIEALKAEEAAWTARCAGRPYGEAATDADAATRPAGD